MQNTAKVIHPDDWMTNLFATYGNENNSFSKNEEPVILDYIFKRLNSPGKISASETWFDKLLYHKDIPISRLIEENEEITEYAKSCPNPYEMYHNLQKNQSVQNRFEGVQVITNDVHNVVKTTAEACRTRITARIKQAKDRLEAPANRDDGITTMSLSDHEAIASTIKVWKKDKYCKYQLLNEC